MADREETLKLKIQLENAQTVEQLEQILEDINKQLVLVDKNSEAFDDLSKVADDATEELNGLNKSIEELNGQTETLEKGMEGLNSVTQDYGAATEDLTKALDKSSSTMNDYSSNLKIAKGNLDDVNKTIAEQKKFLTELERELLQVERLQKSTSKTSLVAQEKLTVQADHLKDSIKDQRLSLKELNNERADASKRVKDLTSEQLESTGVLGVLDKLTNGYASRLVKLRGNLTKGAKGVKGLTSGFKFLKVAIAATGIGLLVIALGALVTFFTRSQRGADKLSQAMAGIGAVMDVVLDRLVLLGEGLFNLFIKRDFRAAMDLFKQSVSGIAEEIRNEVEAASSLEAALQRLEQREQDLIVVQAEREKQVARLRLEAEESGKDFLKGAESIRKAMGIERQIANDNIGVLKERSRILQEQLSLGENTRAELTEGQEAIAAVIKAEGTRDETLRALASRLRSFEFAQIAANKALKEFRDIQSEADVLEEELEIDEEGQFVEDGQQRLESEGKALRAEEQRQADLDQEQREKNSIRQLEWDEFVADKTEEIEMNAAIARQQIALDLYSSLLSLSQTFFSDSEEGQKKAFEFNKAVQTAEAIVTTILSAQKAFASQINPLDPTSLVRATIAAGIATAAGLARVAAIQRTRFNSKTVEATSTGSVPEGGGQQFNVQPIVPLIDTDLARQTTKVIVVETDITNTVNNVDTILQKATVVQ